MKFCIVHYNTPELTTCLCASINKFHNDAEIIILDNSDKKQFNHAMLFNNVTVLDNTKEQLFKYDLKNKVSNKKAFEEVYKINQCGSAKHSISIQYLLDTINEDFILLDSDVLLKKNVYEIIKQDSICSADIINATNSRILPFIIYFNIDIIKSNKIRFFDKTRMSGLSNPINSSAMGYDTGSSFYEDIIKFNIKMNKIKYEDYLIHYGRGSWKKAGRKTVTYSVIDDSFQNFLIKNKQLWS